MGELAASGNIRSGKRGWGALMLGSHCRESWGRPLLAGSDPPGALQLKLPKKSECRRALDFPILSQGNCFPSYRNLSSALGSMSPTTSSQVLARKRRRGIIEKRRRDRINNSLSELRRLVPSAFEKQGSAKLEKAEILQMTVDHLKMLHTAGGKGIPLQFSLGSAWPARREFQAQSGIGAVPACFALGVGRAVCDCHPVHLQQHMGS